jgi:hypothetical protein
MGAGAIIFYIILLFAMLFGFGAFAIWVQKIIDKRKKNK